MRTNIEIDDELMAAAMQAGPFKTKKEAVEAGLQLLKRQAAYREFLKYRGKLSWGWEEGAELSGASKAGKAPEPELVEVAEPRPRAAKRFAAKTEKSHGRR